MQKALLDAFTADGTDGGVACLVLRAGGSPQRRLAGSGRAGGTTPGFAARGPWPGVLHF